MVRSIRGAKGGYELGLSPDEIKISNIISAVDEEVKNVNCKKDSKKAAIINQQNVLHIIYGISLINT